LVGTGPTGLIIAASTTGPAPAPRCQYTITDATPGAALRGPYSVLDGGAADDVVAARVRLTHHDADERKAPMTPDQYLSERVDDQIQWLSNKSGVNQRRFKRLRLTEIFLAAGIPVLAAYSDRSLAIRLSVALAGALVAIIAGALALWRHQELWIQYRATGEALKRE